MQAQKLRSYVRVSQNVFSLRKNISSDGADAVSSGLFSDLRLTCTSFFSDVFSVTHDHPWLAPILNNMVRAPRSSAPRLLPLQDSCCCCCGHCAGAKLRLLHRYKPSSSQKLVRAAPLPLMLME